MAILTLRDKECALVDSVALSGVEDWSLLTDDPQKARRVVGELNVLLSTALDMLKQATTRPQLRRIASTVVRKLEAVEKRYRVGVTDSEGYIAVARFFAINYHPEMYAYFRYCGALDDGDESPCCLMQRRLRAQSGATDTMTTAPAAPAIVSAPQGAGLTMSEKEAAMGQPVGLTEAADWPLRVQDNQAKKQIVQEINAQLVATLAQVRAPADPDRGPRTCGEISDLIYAPLQALEDRHQVGILDEEGRRTVARFFAIHDCISMYADLMSGPSGLEMQATALLARLRQEKDQLLPPNAFGTWKEFAKHRRPRS